MFADRAAAAHPDFTLTERNAPDVIEICRRLDGLPLAIELAAAKVRSLSPRDIADRLGGSLPLLTSPSRDLPDRHRTIRATIDWSVDLLTPVERSLLEDLGVFAERFTLEAVEAVGRARPWGEDTIETLAALIDASLVQQIDSAGRSVFSLLAIVREYAVESLESRGDIAAIRDAHADHYLSLVREVGPRLRGPAQVEAITELGLEAPNLRAAARHLVRSGRFEDAADFAWTLLPYWWISGYFAGVRMWMRELLAADRPLSDRASAIARFYIVWAELWQRPSEQVVSELEECARLFTASGDEHAAAMTLAARASARLQLPGLDPAVAKAELEDAVVRLRADGDAWGEALAEVALGLLGVVQRDLPEALAHFDRTVEIADAQDDPFTRVVAGCNRGRVYFTVGDVEASEREFEVVLRLSGRLHFPEGAAYGIEGMSAIAAVRGDAWRAGALAAVAATLRETTGMFDVEGFAVNLEPVEALRAADPDGVAAGEADGARLGVGDAIRLALPDAGVREGAPAW
jgi:tetratricopeptide (TPR) repeat protein